MEFTHPTPTGPLTVNQSSFWTQWSATAKQHSFVKLTFLNIVVLKICYFKILIVYGWVGSIYSEMPQSQSSHYKYFGSCSFLS